MMMAAERSSRPPDPVAAARGVGPSHVLDSSSFPVPMTWGSQRLLRCVNVSGRGDVLSAGQKPVTDGSKLRPGVQAQEAAEENLKAEEDDGGLEKVGAKFLVEGKWRIGSQEEDKAMGEGVDGALEEVKEKLMTRLREAADRVQFPVGPVLRDQEREEDTETVPSAEPSSAAAYTTRPWNLRARTAVRIVSRYGFESDAAGSGPPARPVRRGRGDAARGDRPKFSISLSSQEIAEDIYAVTGSLPRSRPRKRARVVQRQLDALFPGSWLTEITADAYKVAD